MRDAMIQVIMAFVSSYGFSMVFQLRKELRFQAALGGMLSWICYLVLEYYMVTVAGGKVFLPCLLASAFAALYAEGMAKFLKAPRTVFVIPAVVPLIPGSTLYYTMSAAVAGDMDLISHFGNLTLQYTLAIAAGISIVGVFFAMAVHKR